MWNFDTFFEPEIIEPQRLCGLFALAEIPLPDDHRGWVTISLDHVSAFVACSSLLTSTSQLTQEPDDNELDDQL